MSASRAAPPAVRVTAHAIDRFLQRSRVDLPRQQVALVVKHAVEMNEWVPMKSDGASRVPVAVEGREFHLVIVETEGVICVVTCLTSAQVATANLNGWKIGDAL